MSYQFVLTNAGKQLEKDAKLQNKSIKLTQVVFGDGEVSEVSPTATALIHEVYRTSISYTRKDDENLDTILIGAIIPANVGNFYIREIGIYAQSLEEDGSLVLYAIGNYPSFYKTNDTLGYSSSLEVEIPLVIGSSTNIEVVVKDTGYADQTALLEHINDKTKHPVWNKIYEGVIDFLDQELVKSIEADMPLAGFVTYQEEGELPAKEAVYINGQPNTQIFITESGEWEAPFTGTYKLLLISGGYGATCRNTGLWAGSSGIYMEAYVQLHKGQKVYISIGAGGIANSNANPDGAPGGHTSFGDISTANAGKYTNKRFMRQQPYDSYSSKCVAGQGFGGGSCNGIADLDGKWYGAGGAIVYVPATDTTEAVVYLGNGHQGCIIAEYYDPTKDTNISIDTATATTIADLQSQMAALSRRIQELESK